MPFHSHSLSRRDFLASAALLATGLAASGAEPDADSTSTSPAAEPVIDIHQHTNYVGRTNEQLIKHQRAMGVTTTVLLPAGSKYGLDAGCGGNQTVVDLAHEHPKEFFFFANEIPDLPEAREEIEKYLKQGAIGIGEQKFRVACDSPEIGKLAELAREHGVPILMHFWHADYNTGIENFHKTLEKYPKVNFIGHAQTWWGNIDKNYDQKTSYPTGPVTPGGIIDRLLTDFPNVYADLSATSGLTALIRDEDFTKGFMQRHQDKLLFGTDCSDALGRGPGCQGAQTLAAVRRIAPSHAIERKILYGNAVKLLKFPIPAN